MSFIRYPQMSNRFLKNCFLLQKILLHLTTNVLCVCDTSSRWNRHKEEPPPQWISSPRFFLHIYENKIYSDSVWFQITKPDSEQHQPFLDPWLPDHYYYDAREMVYKQGWTTAAPLASHMEFRYLKSQFLLLTGIVRETPPKGFFPLSHNVFYMQLVRLISAQAQAQASAVYGEPNGTGEP